MTNKEAIIHIEQIRPKKCKMVNGKLQGGFPDHDSDIGKAIDMAIEALEKQIPKKPFLESKKGIATIAMWHCPVCKNEIISNWNRDIANSYCHHCGQAIDWSEVE